MVTGGDWKIDACCRAGSGFSFSGLVQDATDPEMEERRPLTSVLLLARSQEWVGVMYSPVVGLNRKDPVPK